MLISDVKGINRARDINIIRMYVGEGIEVKEIASQYDMTVSNVRRILWANRGIIKLDKSWEKLRRINYLKRQIKNKSSKKDPADILEQLRKEIEGDSPLVHSESHTHITYVWENNNDTVLPAKLSERDTLPSG